MITNYGYGSHKRPKSSVAKPLDGITFGRVTDIIMSESHPSFDKLGKSQALYGVFYVELGKAESEKEEDFFKFAYCQQNSFKKLPLKNEIVKIEYLPSVDERDDSPTTKKLYWTELVNLWNHPHVSAYPDTLQFGEGQADLGKEFNELDNICTLQAFPGDVIIEGRHGQSIRFGGTLHDLNPWSTKQSNGKPYTILRNGQSDKGVNSGFETYIEDINEDFSSIYLMSDHTVDIQPSNVKVDSWKKRPTSIKAFKGAQIILNSDRIVVNAKKEHILLSAKSGIGLAADSLSFDGSKYIALDANKIYLGRGAFNEQEPVLLGNTSVDWLKLLLKNIKLLVDIMAKTPPVPAVWVGTVGTLANTVGPLLTELETSLPFLNSKKTFVE